MDSIMSFVTSGYQILWIEDCVVPVEEILEGNRVNVISRLLPYLGSVELLVVPTVTTESALTNPRLNGQVSETLFKGV